MYFAITKLLPFHSCYKIRNTVYFIHVIVLIKLAQKNQIKKTLRFFSCRSEQLLITIDTHTGIFQAHVPQYEDNPFTGMRHTQKVSKIFSNALAYPKFFKRKKTSAKKCIIPWTRSLIIVDFFQPTFRPRWTTTRADWWIWFLSFDSGSPRSAFRRHFSNYRQLPTKDCQSFSIW